MHMAIEKKCNADGEHIEHTKQCEEYKGVEFLSASGWSCTLKIPAESSS